MTTGYKKTTEEYTVTALTFIVHSATGKYVLDGDVSRKWSFCIPVIEHEFRDAKIKRIQKLVLDNIRDLGRKSELIYYVRVEGESLYLRQYVSVEGESLYLHHEFTVEYVPAQLKVSDPPVIRWEYVGDASNGDVSNGDGSNGDGSNGDGSNGDGGNAK